MWPWQWVPTAQRTPGLNEVKWLSPIKSHFFVVTVVSPPLPLLLFKFMLSSFPGLFNRFPTSFLPSSLLYFNSPLYCGQRDGSNYKLLVSLHSLQSGFTSLARHLSIPYIPLCMYFILHLLLASDALILSLHPFIQPCLLMSTTPLE